MAHPHYSHHISAASCPPEGDMPSSQDPQESHLLSQREIQATYCPQDQGTLTPSPSQEQDTVSLCQEHGTSSHQDIVPAQSSGGHMTFLPCQQVSSSLSTHKSLITLMTKLPQHCAKCTFKPKSPIPTGFSLQFLPKSGSC